MELLTEEQDKGQEANEQSEPELVEFAGRILTKEAADQLEFEASDEGMGG